ncbi:GTP-binding protein LepA [Thermosporothrix hazakensis]|jgi:GTP-binding protein LepA|uniref:Elongation factor 4 n=2 Tax=Thermosporothrix TaxID=768650 RepID=A0A326UAY2_THEHA|nr:translation elongation factor 4 [Thermosporothrix hazakensis]PZW33002.1 GTP-binding protein LepA [Thermosporothrix hazakensis]BBH90984.1 elongation factor 4 [Thermosporothrix sp. COM3]GCE49034.1 elongation factor 4 [Thermosporothrix hazakensis]
MTDQAHIRNFCIIAHIDHGKSTLADRLLEFTGTVSKRELLEQTLDQMELEREKGITIKAQAVRMKYTAQDGQEYELNLIDTPGHVDFAYEVSRSLAACEGALLVIDATQGVEAQTLANLYLALEADLTIIPVINKIDLPSADPEKVKQEVEDVIGLPKEECILASAKEGIGTVDILEAVVKQIPPPAGDPAGPLRALVFDSHYDAYKGVIAYVRVVDGVLHAEEKVVMMATGSATEVLEAGFFHPRLVSSGELTTGEVGYIATGFKNVKDCRVGDTVTVPGALGKAQPLPGYQPAKSMVFAGLYPVASEDYPELRDALERLKLNDAALYYEPETSQALGFGFRCGFLGLLHMEIIQERLEREYNLDILATAPSVAYLVTKTDGEVIEVDNPSEMPSAGEVEKIEEPFMDISIFTPSRYIGTIMDLVTTRRGIYVDLKYIESERVLLTYKMPLAELIVDFYDQLKSRTQGYASLDYNFAGYEASDLIKLDILVNGVAVDALSLIVHRDKAYYQGRALVEKLRGLIPRQLFEVPIQAAIGSRVIARETVKAMRKDVLAKCYGGDITRKRKLLEKQKEGKKRMKMVGSVEIPQEAFMAVLSLGDGSSSK